LFLTALLYCSGGPFNPFSFLYLVHIALAAVVLRPVWTWSLVAFSGAGFALLFARHLATGEEHAQHMEMHVNGMWVAFIVGAAFIVYFVTRVTQSRDHLQAQLETTRAQADRAARLGSLATLAAGAAHALATPLATIATAAKELDRGLAATTPDLAAASDDARLIREQVERCRSILQQMAADAGAVGGDASRAVAARTLVEASLEGLGDAARVRLVADEANDGALAKVPLRPVAQSLRALVKNALDATPADAGVLVRWRVSGPSLEVTIEDQGPGMPPDVLARAGEPFFTTKPPGRGMGLGLFVTRTVIERLGGTLVLESTPGQGTRARVALPLVPAVQA